MTQKDEKKMRLPLKSERGLITVRAPEEEPAPVPSRSDDPEEHEPEDKDSEEEAAGAQSDDAEDSNPAANGDDNEDVTMEEESGFEYVARVRKQEEQKAAIADICTSVLENPDQHVGRLKDLRRLCSGPDVELGSKTSLLAIVSAATVFKDIIPG